jgi:hypothetical protein
MNDDDLRRFAAEAIAPADSARCPSPERLRAAAERTGSEPERLATLEHVAGCSACREEFDLMRAIATAELVETRSGFRRVGMMGMAAALVLVAGAVLVWRLGPSDEPVRGAADSLALLAPPERWSDAAAPRFSWSALGEGTIYIFELVDSEDRAVHTLTTRDTLLTLPDSLPLDAGREYRWWVRARRTDGRELVSPPRRLELNPR